MTFLSIDCDFWNHLRRSSMRGYLNELALNCRAFGLPLHAVMNHQQMLPLVDASGADTLINLDTHSDLADSLADMLNCGTWVSFCRQRHHGRYHWVHAGPLHEGECNPNDPIWSRRRPRTELTDWAEIIREKVSAPPPLSTLLHDTVAVAVCSSPMYAHEDLIDQFTAWRKDWGIPYKKGRTDEHYGRRATPPRFRLTAAAR